MKRFIFLSALASLFIAPPAWADITATYRAPNFPMMMTVEIADNGDLRYQMSQGNAYGILKDDIDYMIESGPCGPVVSRAEDLVSVQKEAMGEFLSRFKDAPTPPDIQLVESGTREVGDRVGKAYYVTNDKGGPGAVPMLVMSDDPTLAPLGKAFAKQFGTSIGMMKGMIRTEQMSSVANVLSHGAPLLLFGGMELVGVSFDPIDPQRFTLPSAPVSRDDLRKRFASMPPPPTAVIPPVDPHD